MFHNVTPCYLAISCLHPLPDFYQTYKEKICVALYADIVRFLESSICELFIALSDN